MIFREMPDVPPRPATTTNAPFRRWLYSRWGKEHAIIGASLRYAEIGAWSQPLSIKAVWGGSSEHRVDNRRVCVDDDSYIVLNEDRSYGSTWRSERPDRDMAALCVFLKRGMPAEVFGAMSASLTQAADDGADIPHRPLAFCERLRPHDATVTPLLKDLHDAVRRGESDETWFAERYQEMLEAVITGEHLLRRRAETIRSVKPSTRLELMRRVNWASDYILSNYADTISLDDIARAASLSKFHLVRLFRQVHNTTPHAFLQRKRAQVARRMIAITDLDLNDVAANVGFGSRWTMFRQLRRNFGVSGLGLRAR